MVRRTAEVLIDLQRHQQLGDASRDLAVAILSALRTEPGKTVGRSRNPPKQPTSTPRLVNGGGEGGVLLDLKLTGKKIPVAVGEGDKFRFVAKVGEFNANQCLFFLDPVSTEIR